MKNLKRIPLPHLYNCRDLGGYECSDKKTVSFHKLLRADCPAEMTEEEWRKLYDYGVRTVIDLRSPEELQMAPYKAADGIEVISYPMQKNDQNLTEEQKKAMMQMSKEEIAKVAADSFGKSLSEGYVKMLEEEPKRAAGILNLIGENLKKGGVLFHCTAGKDRTGVTAALLYVICGVSDCDIIADYQVTETYQEKNVVLAMVPENLRHLMNSNPENMKDFLKNMKEKNYIKLLYENGLKEEAVISIRENATE